MKREAFEVTEDEILQESFVVDEDSIKEDIVLVEDDDDEIKAEENIQVGAWADASSFVKYCTKATHMAPEIKTDSYNSFVRALAYFANLEQEIEEGVAADAEHGDLSLEQLSHLDNVAESVSEVKEELKKSASRIGLVKSLQKRAAKSARFVYVVDPFLFAVARLIINAKVANGKNIEETFTKMAAKFDINERETFALQQIIRDMGYPIHSSFVADEGAFDMIRQYYA